MNLPAPKGWVVYIGADGTDSIPDNAGYIWWADNIYIEGKRDETFRAALMRTKNNITEIIPLPEQCTGAITLSWTPAGLYAASSFNGITKSFLIPQYAQFTPTPPTYLPCTTVDEEARHSASVALQEARRAMEIANTSLSIAQSAQTLSASLAQSRPTYDQVWQKINDRLFLLIDAIERNDHSDPLNARWIDVLFKKVNDWIYGWMKLHGFIK